MLHYGFGTNNLTTTYLQAIYPAPNMGIASPKIRYGFGSNQATPHYGFGNNHGTTAYIQSTAPAPKMGKVPP